MFRYIKCDCQQIKKKLSTFELYFGNVIKNIYSHASNPYLKCVINNNGSNILLEIFNI